MIQPTISVYVSAGQVMRLINALLKRYSLNINPMYTTAGIGVLLYIVEGKMNKYSTNMNRQIYLSISNYINILAEVFPLNRSQHTP